MRIQIKEIDGCFTCLCKNCFHNNGIIQSMDVPDDSDACENCMGAQTRCEDFEYKRD